MSAKKNEEIALTLTDWAEKGLSKGSYNGQNIQVPYTIPGEEITAHITKVSHSNTYAKLLNLKKSSNQRVSPKCPVFTKCGGCSLQHLSYKGQLESKKSNVSRKFKTAKLPFPDPELLPSIPYHYRNKSQFSITHSPTGEIQIGLSAPRSQRIIDTKRCEIADPISNKVIEIVRNFLETHAPPIFNPKKSIPGISHLITRVVGNSLMVALSSSAQDLPQKEALLIALKQIPEFKSLILNHNPNPEWQVMGPKETLLWGDSQLTIKLAGLTLSLSLQSFFQINTSQIEPMWHKIEEMLAIKKTDNLCDLYCGTGSLTLHLAKNCQTILGIESHPDAVENAIKNARRNNIQNVKFQEGDVSERLSQIPQSCDAIILNPPRKGIDPPIIHALIQLNIPKLLIISCAPETLVANLSPLIESGYKITQTALIDLFPQTHHVETLVLLTK